MTYVILYDNVAKHLSFFISCPNPNARQPLELAQSPRRFADSLIYFILTSLLAQVLSSVHLVSLRSRLMTSSHITAQVCRRKYAAALPLVGYLFRSLWKSSVGQSCLNSWSCCLWHVRGGLYLHVDIQVVTENSVMLEPGWVWNLAVNHRFCA